MARNPAAQTAFGPMVLAAVEQNEPAGRRLVDDDLAELFLPASLRWLVAATRWGPARRLMIGREMTKLHEELARGKLSELERRFAGEVRGEVVIVVRGAPEAVVDRAALEVEVRARLGRGESPKAIAEALSARHSKREVYQLALELKR